MNDQSTLWGATLEYWDKRGVWLMIVGGALGFVALTCTVASSFILWKVAGRAQAELESRTSVMDGEIVRQKTRAAEFERNTRQLEVNLEAAKKETLTLQHSVAWRTIDEKQASIIEKTLSGKNVEGHFIVMNRDDPEQAQFFQRISGFCIKIKVVCRLHLVDTKKPNPFLFAPTGVLSFALEGADKSFVKAFSDAGLVTNKVGTLVGSQLFPEGVTSGIIIAAKPDALEAFPFSTLSPKPPP